MLFSSLPPPPPFFSGTPTQNSDFFAPAPRPHPPLPICHLRPPYPRPLALPYDNGCMSDMLRNNHETPLYIDGTILASSLSPLIFITMFPPILRLPSIKQTWKDVCRVFLHQYSFVAFTVIQVSGILSIHAWYRLLKNCLTRLCQGNDWPRVFTERACWVATGCILVGKNRRRQAWLWQVPGVK